MPSNKQTGFSKWHFVTNNSTSCYGVSVKHGRKTNIISMSTPSVTVISSMDILLWVMSNQAKHD